jgi:phage terminase large subunit-like protein
MKCDQYQQRVMFYASFEHERKECQSDGHVYVPFLNFGTTEFVFLEPGVNIML